MTPMERTEHHFGPFGEKDFGAISGGPFFFRPLCFTAKKREDLPNSVVFGPLVFQGNIRSVVELQIFGGGGGGGDGGPN